MERKLISEADSRPLVVLDPRAPESPEALDAAVRAAASLTVHFAKRGGCGLLLPGDRRAHTIERDLLAWPQAHVRLALVEEHTGPALTAAQNRRGVIAYVAARTVDRVPRGLGRTPGGCLLVIPGALPEPPRRGRGRRLPRLRRRAHRQRGADGDRGERDGMSAGVSALRGPAPALRSAAPDERRPVRALRPSGPQLPFAVARGATFLALATFGALHWMAMLEPTAVRARLVRGRHRRAGDGGPARRGQAGRRARAGPSSPPSPWSRPRSPSSAPAPPTSCCGPTSGTRWPRASRAASTRCPARACPTAASTSGRGS